MKGKSKGKSRSRKNTSKRRKSEGGGCGCSCGSGADSPGFNFKSIMGGSTSFESNGLPSNLPSLGDSGYYNNDPQRMMESGRFLNGGKRKTRLLRSSRRNLGRTKSKKNRRNRGGGLFDYNPLAGDQNNILSAFGNSSGAVLNAKLASGMEIDNSPKTGLFSASNGIKPLV